MKIGIMSMQRIHNYGSFLQAYGMKKTLESIGHSVVFVDYHPGPVTPSRLSRVTLRNLPGKVRNQWRRVLRRFRRKPDSEKNTERYREEQEKHLGFTDTRKYQSEVDVLLTGSDEVFNCLQTNRDVGFAPDLFGKNRRANRLISYAASFGNTTAERLRKCRKDTEIGSLLREFDAISVRDQNSEEIVKELAHRKPARHLDPVFLYDYSGEIGAYTPKSFPLRNYILVYAYPSRISREEAEAIVALAKKLNKPLLGIGRGYRFCDWRAPTPFEMLSYFRHADYVITETFHGTVFSIKYNIPFATIIRDSEGGKQYGNSEKLGDLLRTFSFTDRIIKDASSLEDVLLTPIDFGASNSLIERERESALAYLRQNTVL